MCYSSTARSLSTTRYRFFFFNDTATTEIYTLSLHDALPISRGHKAVRRKVRSPRCRRSGPNSIATRRTAARSRACPANRRSRIRPCQRRGRGQRFEDRKSTRLNSSHLVISYAGFCLKKKNLIELLEQAVALLVLPHRVGEHAVGADAVAVAQPLLLRLSMCERAERGKHARS